MSMEIDVEEGCADTEVMEGQYRAIHEQLVRYVWAAGGAGGQCGVWREHSYARATRDPPRPPRVLLEPVHTIFAPGELIDVVGEDAPKPELPGGDSPSSFTADDIMTDEDGWEESLIKSAPTNAHAKLATRLAELLAELRLMRLAVPSNHPALRREQTRKAAAKARRLLAPAWSWGGATWVVSELLARAGGVSRPLLLDLLGELRLSAPAVAARLPVTAAVPPPYDKLRPAKGERVPDPAHGPLLLWVSSGERTDARWAGRLSALLPVRTLRPPGRPPPIAPAPPDQWCAARAACLRAALTDALIDAGTRPVFIVGCGAGGQLGAVLAGAEVRGAALLGPALAAPDSGGGGGVALDARVPLLVVAGDRTAGGRSAVLAACAGGPGEGGGGGARRLLLVAGADAALRLPGRTRVLHRMPQQALDAAIVEEVVRWATELADTDSEETDTAHGQYKTSGEFEEDEDVSVLTPPPPPCRAPTPNLTPTTTPTLSHATPQTPTLMSTVGGGGSRAIEIVEGRVVQRVSGGTPLVLTPRRALPPLASPQQPPPPPAPAPAPADIMQLPVVFADDPPAPLAASTPAPAPPPASVSVVEVRCSGPSPLTVTSGAGRRSGGTPSEATEQPPLKYTRVIVAKRGPPPPAAAPPPPPPPPLVPRGVTGVGGRPLLLRRTLRVLGRPPGPRRPPN